MPLQADRHHVHRVLPAGNSASSRPTPAMIEAAHRRLLANRTITAAICGDPPPGHSALDKRIGA